jgi:hypothetical protein
MVYSNRYAYDDSRRGQNPTLEIYGSYNPYSIEGYENHNSTRGNISNYTLRVMPYDEDLREDFIDLTQPSSVPIYLLIAIIFILFLLYVV